jgi:hypothetical protein
VDTVESRLPRAGRFPAVQNWHGEKGTSSGIFRQRKCGPRKELSTSKRLIHRAEVARRKEHRLQREIKENSASRTRKDGRSGRSVGWVRKAALVRRIQSQEG